MESEDAEPAAILSAIRAGRVAISATRDGPVLLRHDGRFLRQGRAREKAEEEKREGRAKHEASSVMEREEVPTLGSRSDVYSVR